MHGGVQAHPHIREIVEGEEKIVIRTQIEGRNFPEHDGHRSAIYDGDYLDTLVMFMPNIPAKEISFETLPALIWTPDSDAEVTTSPPCPYRQ